MAEWVNPILLEPWFEVAGPDPIRIPLAPAVPASLLGRFRYPRLIGSGFRAYVADEGPPPAAVLAAISAAVLAWLPGAPRERLERD